MTDLIHRLEAAEGPSRDLDAEIAGALIGKDRVSFSYVEGEEHEWQPGWPESAIWLPVPFYTASLDAAKSLSNWQLYSITLNHNGYPIVRLCRSTHPPTLDFANGVHASLEIAWCIAALIARRKEKGS